MRVITLPDYDVRKYKPPENVYGLLAAPPCTQFSILKNAQGGGNFREGMEIVKACFEIIWECRISGSLKFWALENPHGYLRHFLGTAPLTFSPCDFGDPYTKQTDIWGYFKEPKKNAVKPLFTRFAKFNEKAYQQEVPKSYVLPGIQKRTIRRSMTPQGFARAFFEANH